MACSPPHELPPEVPRRVQLIARTASENPPSNCVRVWPEARYRNYAYDHSEETHMSKPIPPISKFMTTTPISVEAGATLAEAKKLMEKQGIRHLPVVSNGKLLGIITDRDLKFVESFPDVNPKSVAVEQTMTEEPYSVSPSTLLDEVAFTMAENRYGSAVVVDNGHVVGLFTTVDACRALSELLETRLRKA
jgi:acetoin utilization protein AcuB